MEIESRGWTCSMYTIYIEISIYLSVYLYISHNKTSPIINVCYFKNNIKEFFKISECLSKRIINITSDLNELKNHSSGVCAIVNWMHSASKAQNKFATNEISSMHLRKMKKNNEKKYSHYLDPRSNSYYF
jgi:hypothetical protein